MALILLNGPPTAGKSTIARMLMDEAVNPSPAQLITLNRPFTKFVKKALALNDAEMEACKDTVCPELGFQAPVRDALIAAANAVERVDPDVWVKRALDQHDQFPYFKDGVYVLDAIGKRTQFEWIIANTKANVMVLYVGRDKMDLLTEDYIDGRQRIRAAPDGRRIATLSVCNEHRNDGMQQLMESVRMVASVIHVVRLENWKEI